MQDLLKCKNVKFLGMWTDPDGTYGRIPIFEIDEPSCEDWNKKAKELRERHENENREHERAGQSAHLHTDV